MQVERVAFERLSVLDQYRGRRAQCWGGQAGRLARDRRLGDMARRWRIGPLAKLDDGRQLAGETAPSPHVPPFAESGLTTLLDFGFRQRNVLRPMLGNSSISSGS